MVDMRCKNCGALLAKENIRAGEIEIKCPKCNTFNTIRVDTFGPIVYSGIKKKRSTETV